MALYVFFLMRARHQMMNASLGGHNLTEPQPARARHRQGWLLCMFCYGQIAAGSMVAPLFASTLAGSSPLVRGPYLQLGTSTSIAVRWRTTTQTDSVVQCGLSPERLELRYGDATRTTEHQVLLSGLQPETKYFYSVASSEQLLAGGPDHYFVTMSVAAKPTRIWVTSDMQSSHPETLQAYQRFALGQDPDLWLSLGDNGGEQDAEYQTNLFNVYASMLQRTVLWPCRGNHDSYLGHVYPDIFNLPTGGEAGGVPSGTEYYYSFNYGNIHVLALDSSSEDRTPQGAMYAWLERDLKANNRDWLIAFWHCPPYTKGHYDSDLEPEMREMRENFLPLLEACGVDLVLSGDNHIYERSFLLDSHYGVSASLQPRTMIKNGGDGRWQGSGPYCKPTLGPAPHEGAVYVKATSAYVYEMPVISHPAMFMTADIVGSLILDFNGNVLEAKFLGDDGQIRDEFTMLKGISSVPPRILGCQEEAGQFQIRWHAIPGRYYRVERQDELSSAWKPASPWILAEDMAMSWAEPANIVNGTRFYRLSVVNEQIESAH